jgi:hypothetical protein
MVAAPMSSWVAERVRAHQPVVTLRDYQDEAVTAVARAVEYEGRRRVLVVLPTGAGKTLVFGALAYAWLADAMGRVLVLAHRDELIQQAVEKLSYVLPRHLIGVVKAEQDETDAPVVVASVQTLVHEQRLARVGRFGLIVGRSWPRWVRLKLVARWWSVSRPHRSGPMVCALTTSSMAPRSTRGPSPKCRRWAGWSPSWAAPTNCSAMLRR